MAQPGDSLTPQQQDSVRAVNALLGNEDAAESDSVAQTPVLPDSAAQTESDIDTTSTTPDSATESKTPAPDSTAAPKKILEKIPEKLR